MKINAANMSGTSQYVGMGDHSMRVNSMQMSTCVWVGMSKSHPSPVLAF